MRTMPETVGEYLHTLCLIEEAWMAQWDRAGKLKWMDGERALGLRADIMREIDRYRRARTAILHVADFVPNETPLSEIPLHVRLNLPALAIGDAKAGYTMQEVVT